jgi:hypothetical protein
MSDERVKSNKRPQHGGMGLGDISAALTPPCVRILARVAVADIFAGATLQGVIALAAKELILAWAPQQPVIAQTATDDVVAPFAVHNVVALPSADDVIPRGAHQHIGLG